MNALRRTPLFDQHVELGARMVEFAGFEMPVQYTSILAEHAAVRERVGLFDVSHMGQIHIEGPAAVEAVERLVTCRVATLGIGRVRYGMLCNDAGGVVDDITLYRISEDSFFLCVNAANREKDAAWIHEHALPGAEVTDRGDETGLLALQGPASRTVLESVLGHSLAEIRRFAFASVPLFGGEALVSRTGYTGSEGFEIYLAAEDTPEFFRALLEKGHPHGIAPVGLGARDTLRLEAALPLYGHELDDASSPLEAGLDRFVKRDEGGFIGAEAIERRAGAGHDQILVGFMVEGRGVARAEYPIATQGREIGRVTSGAPSPTLGKSIGLGYVPPEHSEPGTSLEVTVRGRALPVTVVTTPFVRKAGTKEK